MSQGIWFVSHIFARCASQKTVRFSHGRRFFDSRNVQKRATKSDTSGHCLLQVSYYWQLLADTLPTGSTESVEQQSLSRLCRDEIATKEQPCCPSMQNLIGKSIQGILSLWQLELKVSLKLVYLLWLLIQCWSSMDKGICKHLNLTVFTKRCIATSR